MPLRSPIPNFQTSEISNAVSVTLGTGVVTSQSIVPTKAAGQSIIGVQLRIAATITQSGASAWTLSQLINELKIMKGSTIMVDPQSYKQLQNLFNSLTSMNDTTNTTYFNNPSNAGTAGQSSNTFDVFLPFNFTTETPIVITLGFKAYSTITNCTAGSATITVTFLYSTIPVTDDLVKIITAPANLSTNTDVDVSQFFSDSRKIKEVWYDVTADSNLNYQKFIMGSTVVYDAHTAFQLRAVTINAPWMSSIAGFFAAMDMPVIYPSVGTNSNKPQLILNLSSAIAPTFYLFIQP